MLATIHKNGAWVSDPDADLIYGLKSGDENALAGLMDRHMSAIHKQAFYMLGDQMAAEDVTQTVFLKTWERTKDWQAGQANLLTWMRRVTRNACLDILKKKKPIYTDTVPEMEDAAHSPFESLSETQRSYRVGVALAQLPENQRAALTLAYYAKAEPSPARTSFTTRFMPIAASLLAVCAIGFGTLQFTQNSKTETVTAWQEAATDLGFEDIYDWVETEETTVQES